MGEPYLTALIDGWTMQVILTYQAWTEKKSWVKTASSCQKENI